MLIDWFKANQLSINLSKTVIMYFGPDATRIKVKAQDYIQKHWLNFFQSVQTLSQYMYLLKENLQKSPTSEWKCRNSTTDNILPCCTVLRPVVALYWDQQLLHCVSYCIYVMCDKDGLLSLRTCVTGFPPTRGIAGEVPRQVYSSRVSIA